MEVKIRKIGNSLGIILPSDIIRLMSLKEGDSINMEGKENEILIALRKKR
jgi:putative addiction module antidote